MQSNRYAGHQLATRVIRFVVSATCVVSVVFSGASAASNPALLKVAVIGDQDERLTGNFEQPREPGSRDAIRHFARALRISFPMRGALAVTGSPLCYRDIVLTVAHIVKLHGDATATPRGLRVSLPDLKNPGNFSGERIVTDYMLAGARRQYNPDQVSSVADDFMLLQLNAKLPSTIQPLALRTLAESKKNAMPVCDQPTVNVAYHDDLGVRNGQVMANQRNAGKVPLLTRSGRPIARYEDPALFGDWYKNPLIALTDHDTETSASGSAIVCPASSSGPAAAQRHETLQAIVIGQAITKPVTKGTASHAVKQSVHNVVTTNTAGIYTALARLKGISVDELASACASPQ